MTKITEVPSPFCGIGSDDLTVEVDGNTISIIKNGCNVNTPAFEQKMTDTSPRVDGKKVDLATAVKQATKLLKKANQPVIGGCATDVNGMRALMALADRNGAVVDNMSFSAAKRNILAMQDSGWMNTTLAEIKNRCDLLVVIGCDIEAFSPRFYERYLWTKDAMFLKNTSDREVVYMGKAPSGNASTSPKKVKAQVLDCFNEDLPEVTAVLRALVKGQPILVEQVAGVLVKDLQVVADKLKAANYGVVVWAAGALDFNHAELTVQTICEIVKDVNASRTRCSGFPLGGKEGDQTANQVCGWQTGYPARMRFSSGMPEYDPFLYDINVMFANGEVDAFLWVQAFNVKSTPPHGGKIPTIVVGRSGMEFEVEPDVFIPVGTPGIDHVGHTYRLDNVVAIRLKKLRSSGLPSTAEVLTAIEQGLVG